MLEYLGMGSLLLKCVLNWATYEEKEKAATIGQIIREVGSSERMRANV